ncbi:hypothetical protein ACOYW6_07715 [Parablastomonas sp. CN1-191]|uniref:hypothetical protein n=1 Tax=Parablastomonas sp. CN1-191 TaxID=3400908 RepID=UPI003BF7D8D9
MTIEADKPIWTAPSVNPMPPEVVVTMRDRCTTKANELLKLAENCDNHLRRLGRPEARALVPDAQVALTQHLAMALARMRSSHTADFSHEYFRVPGWHMMLELYAADAVRPIWRSTKELIVYSGASDATALRWIAMLVDAGMIERGKSSSDDRGSVLRMTARGVKAMYDFLLASSSCFDQVAIDLQPLVAGAN